VTDYRTDSLRCAVIGCGAVAERVHLPALARCAGLVPSLLVDRDEARARLLASQYGVPRVSGDFRDAIGGVDAAVIGVPHHLHEPMACALLEAGIHVLVEKPMALSAAACDRMIAAATRTGAVLAVGLLRRCSPSLQWVKQALDAGALGRIRRFELCEGAVYRWPVVSAGMFRPEGGGGVLADAGAHALDLVLWWFGGWRALRYRDDARGGVEADCLLELEMQDGAQGIVELSRTRDMPNSCIITGDRGTIEVGTKTDSIATLRWRNGVELSSRPTADGAPPPTSLVDLCVPQFEQFARAIHDGVAPIASGADARASIALLAACYQAREPWVQPWDVEPASTSRPRDPQPSVPSLVEVS
jgi:predicted dehydrogenase